MSEFFYSGPFAVWVDEVPLAASSITVGFDVGGRVPRPDAGLPGPSRRVVVEPTRMPEVVPASEPSREKEPEREAPSAPEPVEPVRVPA